MKWLVSLAQSVYSKLSDLRDGLATRVRPRRPRIRYERVDEFPDLLKPSTLYVAGEDLHTWAAALLCPCGCGAVIELNLLRQASPCWSVRHHRDGSVSLMPSIWRSKGCRSHFFIRNSKIDWCRFDSDSSLGRIRRP